MYQPDARGSQASIPRIPVPFPPVAPPLFPHATIAPMYPRPRHPLATARAHAPSSLLYLSLSLCCRVPTYLNEGSHAPYVSLTLSFPARRVFSSSPPSTFPVILFLSFSRLPIYLSIHLSASLPFSLSIHLFVCRSIPDLASLSFCGFSSSSCCSPRSGSPCANVSKSVYDITTCSPAQYFLSPCRHPRLIPLKPRLSTSSFISRHSLAA